MYDFKGIVGVAALVLFLGVGFHSTCFRVTNEIGPIGADKAGRQIFLQTLQHYLGDAMGVEVSSEFFDANVIERLLQEPMRTTIRFVAPESLPQPDRDAPGEFLATNPRAFFAQFNPPPDAQIALQEHHSILLSDFLQELEELGATTVGEMLSAMGFRKFETYYGQRLLFARELPTVGRQNVKWVGG